MQPLGSFLKTGQIIDIQHKFKYTSICCEYREKVMARYVCQYYAYSWPLFIEILLINQNPGKQPRLSRECKWIENAIVNSNIVCRSIDDFWISIMSYQQDIVIGTSIIR